MNKIKLEFTQEQLAVIRNALNELPYKQAVPVIMEINKQIQVLFDTSIDKY